MILGDNGCVMSAFPGETDPTYDPCTALGVGETDQSGGGPGGARLRQDAGTLLRRDRTVSRHRDLGDATVGGIGLSGSFDRQDDTICTTHGNQLSLVLYGNRFDGLRTRDRSKGVLLYDTFHPLGDKRVLAARGAFCGASDETPFFDLCPLGGTDAMRGFPVTHRLASAQVECRRVFAGRLGGLVLAGAGMVGADTDDL